MDHRPRPEPVQPLQALRDAEQPADADRPADLRVRGGVAEDGAEGAAAGQFEDEDEAGLGDLQHAKELDQVAVVEPQAQPSLLQDLFTQARPSVRSLLQTDRRADGLDAYAYLRAERGVDLLAAAEDLEGDLRRR
eukprot:COSAG04_NODE_2092_length_4811_cov_4.293930_3_plen_135_part_00